MCRPRFSYQDSVAVIHLMLNDLCRKAGELVLLFAKFYVAVYDFKPFMPHRFSLSGEGETSLLGLVLLGGCFYNLQIQHDEMRFTHAYGNYALLFANHVGGKPDTVSDMGFERIEQVVCNREVGFHGLLGWLPEKHCILDDRSYHLPYPPLL